MHNTPHLHHDGAFLVMRALVVLLLLVGLGAGAGVLLGTGMVRGFDLIRLLLH